MTDDDQGPNYLLRINVPLSSCMELGAFNQKSGYYLIKDAKTNSQLMAVWFDMDHGRQTDKHRLRGHQNLIRSIFQRREELDVFDQWGADFLQRGQIENWRCWDGLGHWIATPPVNGRYQYDARLIVLVSNRES